MNLPGCTLLLYFSFEIDIFFGRPVGGAGVVSLATMIESSQQQKGVAVIDDEGEIPLHNFGSL